MLKIYRDPYDLNMDQLLLIYRQSIENRMETEGICRFQAEQDFIDYMTEDFFSVYGAFFAVWTHESACVSAVRLEPYQNGYILSGLETQPESRDRGYASQLILAVLQYMTELGNLPVYAHVDKKNIPSLAVHTFCGFRRTLEYGKLLDGTISSNYCTLCFEG